MNKKIMMLVAIVVLVGIVGFVSAGVTYDSSTNLVTINVEKAGWYLIPLGFTLDGCQREMISENEWTNTMYVKAGWVWSPTLNKYLGGRDFNRFEGSQSDLQQFESDRSNKYLYATPKLGGAWVYISGKCELKDYLGAGSLDSPEVSAQLNQMKLAKGWNFFTIVPTYKGKSFNDIKGSCSISKMADWNAESQKWLTEGWQDELNGPMNNFGKVLLIKVAEECHLGLESSETSTEPPAIPS